MNQTDMTQIEKNIVESFNLAKEDIIILQSMIQQLQKEQQIVEQKIEKQKERELYLMQKVIALEKNNGKQVKTVEKIIRVPSKKRKKVFVASKSGKSVHEKKCPYAKNIKRKSMVQFATKNRALKQGYDLCACV